MNSDEVSKTLSVFISSLYAGTDYGAWKYSLKELGRLFSQSYATHKNKNK
jgi:hypothetical protein